MNSRDETSSATTISGQFVQSLERGLAVIRAFDEEHERLTLSEAARRTGLTRAAARRFLLTLETLGYVRSDGREFSLTARVLELGFSYLASLPFRRVSDQTLSWLSEQTGQSCSISVLDGADIVYVARVHTRDIMRVNISIGTRFPAFATSMGRVLLAGLSEERLEEVLKAEPRNSLTPHTVIDRYGLHDIIAQTRARGWALVDQELEVGLCSLAVPIHGPQSNVVAALNLSMPSQRVAAMGGRDQVISECLPLLNQAASEIEQIARVMPIE